ncbi:MAG TPA: carboxypeptidase regulatory-like domain-containing protein, partial [Thermoanaerobaculia bacterium]|nr:carboxypeptidase regulatory-like domain-containing protein [Thermoanaerobaculia bacterium]
MKRFGLVLALLAVVFIAGPAVAQEQTGQLVGKIASDSGETLPGVSVEIKGPAGTLVAITDARGEYRFPRVSPGTYKLTARLQGFQTYEASRVGISLGDRASVNITLRISSVSETVVVTGDSVQIAVGENQTSTAIAAAQIAILPKGRDFTTVVTQAPGVSNEANLGGISIDGASGAENVFVIDGINTTSIRTGQSAKGLITDFIEELQVKSSGYNAEFGGSMGGVINVITKSGANDFRGDFGMYYSDNDLNGSVRRTLRLNPTTTSIAEYVTYPDDTLKRWEPGGTI